MSETIAQDTPHPPVDKPTNEAPHHSSNIIRNDAIGRILKNQGLVTEDEIVRALAFQEEYGGRLGMILVRLGSVSEDQVLLALGEQLGMQVVGNKELPKDPQQYLNTAKQTPIPADWWIDQSVLAWSTSDAPDTIWIIARDPMQPDIQESMEAAFPNQALHWCLTRSRELDQALDSFKSLAEDHHTGDLNDVSHLRELAEEAPVVELVNNVFSQALDEGASDIHIEPLNKTFDIRFRIDGVLQNKLSLPRDRFDAVASRVKLIAGIDIAERRLPQDGRIGLRISGTELDIRVSSLPGVHGESIVMRLLIKERQDFHLDRIGFADDHMKAFSQLIEEPHGIFLVTGPTGSGKSTTLYTALQSIIDGKRKIITVEDPVEYNIPGITQVQTKTEIGYTFAKALRAILRQDPDTIMIGEIRDLETAEIAVQASLTGHMVFSTLHTNDSLSAFTRLTDMGLEPFLVTSTVRGILAQRLVRRLCGECKQPWTPPDKVVERAAEIARNAGHASEAMQWFSPSGCPHCQGTGYRGRFGIFELATIDNDLTDAILRQASPAELQEIAVKRGFRTLADDGLLKASNGDTSVEEVARVAGHIF